MGSYFHVHVYFGNEWNWSPRPVSSGYWQCFPIAVTDAEAISLWCGAERILRGWVVSPAALQFLEFHRFVSE